MTSDDHCYYGARGTRAISTSPNNNDGSSDISWSLLLPFTVVTGMTSDDHYYYWAYDTRAVTTSPHGSDARSDNSCLSLLVPTVVMGKRSVVTGL
jgi:hypothetical protein